MTYTPTRVPNLTTVDELRKFVEEEFQLLSRSFQNTKNLQIEVLHTEPAKPREGMIVYADGSDWNPGSGDGFYGREAGAWVKL